VNTVAQFAAELKKTPDPARAAEVRRRRQSHARRSLTESDKQRLLSTCRPAMARRRPQEDHVDQEVDQRDQAGRCHGKARTIQVEVRKKRTFIKRDDTPAEAAARAAPLRPNWPPRGRGAASGRPAQAEEARRTERKEREEREELERREREAEERARAYAEAEAAKVRQAKEAKKPLRQAAQALAWRPRPKPAPRPTRNPASAG
jgi:translation initiation factor IF-2